MRSYHRFTIDQEIDCRVEGVRDVATLYNLSSGGCMIECTNELLKEGAEIQVDLKGLLRAPGTVVWRIGRNAGVKFEIPVHHSVIEQLGYRENAGEFEVHEPLDRFGLPLFG